MKEIAVDGCSYKYTISATPPIYSVNDPNDGAITAPPSMKVKADGKRVYKDGAGFSATVIAPATAIGGVVTPPTFNISSSFISTAVKAKADGTVVLLKGDKTGLMTANFIDTNSSTEVSTPIVVTVTAEIDDPGQKKVKSN